MLVLALLQLGSALHFMLVPHTFSAALGGVVHVHTGSAARAEPRAHAHGAQAPAWVADAPACAAEACPFASAPQGSLARAAAPVSGAVAFGAPSLLSAAEARSPHARRVFLSAPKTSPPV